VWLTSVPRRWQPAQHEFDHLDGVLFVDHLSRLKRDFLLRKFRKSRREKDTD
jgi:peptide deformylase